MSFDKTEQQRRAAEFAAQALAKGQTQPAPHSIPLTQVQPSSITVAVPSAPDEFAPITIGPEDKRHPAHKAWKAKQPKKTKSGGTIEPFTNKEGQVINPGDKVVTIATGYSHRIKVRIGTYVGLSKGKNPTVEVLSKDVYGYWYNGKNVGYYEARNLGIQPTRRDVMQKVTFISGRVYKTV